MEIVLIALDYDPTAQKVAEAGFSLAKKMGAKAILLHVISLDPVNYSSKYMDSGTLPSGNIDILKKISKQFLDKTKYHLGDEHIQTLVKEGDFASSILLSAKELQADIIVMGSHSYRWLEAILMGSVTEEVLHQTSIPLFIVPTKKLN
jgi:nucleotide-binding universal stress UspA family protein